MPGIEPKSRVDPIGEIIKVTENVPIRYAAQEIGIYLQPEWAAKEGEGKYFCASCSNYIRLQFLKIEYTVPTGKEFFITNYSGWAKANKVEDADKNQFCVGYMDVAYEEFGAIGGNGGVSLTFPTPIRATAGQLVRVWLCGTSNHNTDMYVSLAGYEVNV